MEVDLFEDKENRPPSSHPLQSKAAILRSKHLPAFRTSLPEQSSTRLGLSKASSTSSQTERIFSSQVKPARPTLQPLKLSSINTSFASLPPSQLPQDCEVEEQPIPASMFQFPPPLPYQPYPTPHRHQAAQPAYPQQQHPFAKEAPVTCVVEQEGHLRLHLRSEVTLDISPNMSARLDNPRQETSLALSGCCSQLAMVHPSGRLLQYGSRIEVQVEDKMSVKNAKVHPKGISFTANNMALVYLLDDAGARSTSDMFHDLHASHVVNTLFSEVAKVSNCGAGVALSVEMLHSAQYWRDQRGCDKWRFGDLEVTQTRDGLVTVQRMVDGEPVMLRASPNNGKVRFDSRAMQLTASLGDEAHLFLRAQDRRLHYSGLSTIFTVRNGGHSAGFDEEGNLRIF